MSRPSSSAPTLPHRLHRVGVEGDAGLRGQPGQLVDRLDRADLVVGPLGADHRDLVAVRGEQVGQHGRVDPAGRVDRQPADLGALVGGEPLDRVQHRVVLDRGGHHAVAAAVGAPAGPVDPLGREVVALRPAAGEDHLGRAGAEHRGDALAGLLDQPAGTAAGGVQGRRIADLAGGRDIGVERFGEHRRGRRVIQVGHHHEAYALTRQPKRSGWMGARKGPAETSAGPGRDVAYLRLRISSAACGTILNRSPTTP
jgi:hypothetical protein